MSDILMEYLLKQWTFYDTDSKKCLDEDDRFHAMLGAAEVDKIITSLKNERESHAKEIEGLVKEIEGLVDGLVDAGMKNYRLEQETLDLRRRIAELEAQLQDFQPLEPQHYRP